MESITVGLIILLASGALLGWLGAIVMRVDDARRIRITVGTGCAAALAGGIAAAQNSLFNGISATAVLSGFIAAVVAVTILALFWNRMSNGDFR